MDSQAIQLFTIFGIGAALTLAAGLYCILTGRTLIRVLIGMEVMTKSVTLLLITAGNAVKRTALAQSLVITLIVVEVTVIVVAVGIVLCVRREHGSIDTNLMQDFKG